MNSSHQSSSHKSTSHQPNVCIYAVVDVSGSMQGAKIQSVCTTIQEMFTTWPDSVLFDVTLFSNDAEKLFTALKSKLDINDIVQKIQAKCNYGGGTALYDAWGDMLTSIPDSVFAKEETQMFVLTDGEDNMSKRYTLNDVLELTKKRISNRAQFTLIDVGKSNLNLTQSINTMGKKQMQALDVDSSATAIKTALQSVNKDILTSIRSTQSQKPNVVNNRILSSPPTVTANNQSQQPQFSNRSQHPMLSTTRKAPSSSAAHNPAHSATNNAAGLLTTNSRKIASDSATNQSARPNDPNVSYVLK